MAALSVSQSQDSLGEQVQAVIHLLPSSFIRSHLLLPNAYSCRSCPPGTHALFRVPQYTKWETWGLGVLVLDSNVTLHLWLSFPICKMGRPTPTAFPEMV